MLKYHNKCFILFVLFFKDNALTDKLICSLILFIFCYENNAEGQITVPVTWLCKAFPYLWLRKNCTLGQLLVMYLHVIHIMTDMKSTLNSSMAIVCFRFPRMTDVFLGNAK